MHFQCWMEISYCAKIINYKSSAVISEIKEYVDFFQNMYILLLWTMNLTVLCEPTKTWPIFKGNKESDRKRRNAQEANKIPLMSSLWSDYKKIKQKYW